MPFWLPIFAGDAITSPGCCTQLVMQGQDASCPYPSSPEKESPDVHMAAKISTKATAMRYCGNCTPCTLHMSYPNC